MGGLFKIHTPLFLWSVILQGFIKQVLVLVLMLVFVNQSLTLALTLLDYKTTLI